MHRTLRPNPIKFLLISNFMAPLPISRIPQTTDWFKVIFWKIFIHWYVIYLKHTNKFGTTRCYLTITFTFDSSFSLLIPTVHLPIHTSNCLFNPCLQIPWLMLYIFRIKLIFFTIHLNDLSGLSNSLINLKPKSQLRLLSLTDCLPTATNKPSNSIAPICWMSLISITTAFYSYYMSYFSNMLWDALPPAWPLPLCST